MDKKTVMFSEKNRREVVLERVLFVDPGLSGKGTTGYAFFEYLNTKATKKKLEAPSITGILKGPGNEQWDNRVWSICSAFAGIMTSLAVEDVVIEFPALFSGNAKSQTSAAKGDLFKLTFLVGGLSQVARERTGNLPVLVLPAEWKGQLPKNVVDTRITREFGKRDDLLQEHISDAVGMGLSAQGRL